MTRRADRLRQGDEPARNAAKPQPRTPSAEPWVLALQRTAGNQAVAQVLARKTKVAAPPRKKPAKKPPPPAVKPLKELDPNGDLAFALDYVNDHYERGAFLLSLRNDVMKTASENAKTFLALKDPPSIADAVIGEIFKQAIGLIPGGKIVTMALTAGAFAAEMSQLRKDLDEYPIPGVSLEEERKRGPSEATKAKAEKRSGQLTKGYEIGKSVVDAGLAAARERAAAAQAEADAKEASNWQSGRIAEWRKAQETLFAQEEALKAELEVMVREGKDPGKLKALVVKRLGPYPKTSDQLQRKLERELELAIYASKMQWVAEHHIHHKPGATYSAEVTDIVDPGSKPDYEGLEMTGTSKKRASFEHQTRGDKPTKVLLRRIADLSGQPAAADSEFVAFQVLKLRTVHRRIDIQTLMLPPRAG